MSSISKFKKLAGISALTFAALTAANSVNAANWRYAHEEYEGDVQDVFAYSFKEYIEDNSKHTVQVYRFGELGESDDIMEQTQAGILNFVNQSPGFTGALIPEAQIFFIPYLMPTDMGSVVTFSVKVRPSTKTSLSFTQKKVCSCCRCIRKVKWSSHWMSPLRHRQICKIKRFA